MIDAEIIIRPAQHRSSPAGVIRFYGRQARMDRQQIIAVFFALLMVSSMVAYGVSLL
ncbi:surface glycoprotein (TIGR04207 family) [Halorubrum trapanicum]|uniref:Surface glycoprotein (TIGR04207 family) n=1 Tax=Halorubrum trapanicum TaxID=29284 RepID=A0A8J7R912_9EURY|nr:surface glycoprotein [Halorubrum trapanicum]MBP1902504.1 surface glycoprotein (TIGR04207 family) [Halorubrum trapanicum]